MVLHQSTVTSIGATRCREPSFGTQGNASVESSFGVVRYEALRAGVGGGYRKPATADVGSVVVSSSDLCGSPMRSINYS